MSTLMMKLSDMRRGVVSIKGLFWLILLCFPALLLYGFFYSDDLLFYVMQLQQKMHRELATLLQQVKQNPGEYGPALILASFLYGIFHAAGPGHGKAIIATYMGTQVTSLKKGVQLSFMAAFLQAAVAVLLVTALVRLLELSMRQSQWVGAQFEAMSYLLVVVMGSVVCFKQFRHLRQLNKAQEQSVDSVKSPSSFVNKSVVNKPVFDKAGINKPAINRPIIAKTIVKTAAVKSSDAEKPGFVPVSGGQSARGMGVMTQQHQQLPDGSCSCGHKHMPLPEELEKRGCKETAGIVLSMGLRPCTGALLVLMLANALGLYWYGVLSSLLIALGTAITVSTIAFLSVSVRNYAGQLMKLYQKSEGDVRWINMLGILGGVVLILLGSGLFWSFIQLSQQTRPF